jgi:hypothetical protein
MLRNRYAYALGTAATIALISSGYSRIPAARHSIEPAGFYCGNHRPVHYVKTTAEVTSYTARYNCSGWSATSTGTVFGKVIHESSAVPGATVTMRAGDGSVLAVTTTNSEGGFTLSNVPRQGQYEVQVTVVGFQINKTIIDAASEGIVLRIPSEVPDL